MAKKENFVFWCPLDITKAKNDKGEEVMRLGGIASTMDKDADGEFLDPSGFDIKEFKKSGVVNWHHQAKNSPATIIGEPHKAEITKKGFYVETDLYPSSDLAQEVYTLAKTLAKDSKSRRLGYSIEGSVIERDVANPKIVKQAKITGLAITHMPKNAQTFADIIKGEDPCWDGYEMYGTKDKNGKTVPNCIKKDEDEDVEKTLDTTAGRATMPESVDGYKVKNVSQEVMYDKIFDTFPGISIEKAEQVFELLNKIKKAMATGKTIETQDLEKAMAHLGLGNLDDNPFLEKACKSNEDANGDTNAFKKGDKKDPKDMSAQEVADAVEKELYGDDDEDIDGDMDDSEDEEKGMKKGMGMKKGYKKGMGMKKTMASKMMSEDAEEDDSEEDDSENNESEEGGMKKKPAFMMKNKRMSMKKGLDNELVKAIDSVKAENKAGVQALATLVKASMDAQELIKGELDSTRNELAEAKDLLSKALDTIDELGGKSQGRKSLTKGYVDRQFDGNNLSKGMNGNVLSMSNNKREIVNILDSAAFSKGFDEELSKAVTSFEAGAPLTPNVIARLRNEHSVIIEQ